MKKVKLYLITLIYALMTFEIVGTAFIVYYGILASVDCYHTLHDPFDGIETVGGDITNTNSTTKPIINSFRRY